jgi:glycosyltransferase involved in cell wall biosynthesis
MNAGKPHIKMRDRVHTSFVVLTYNRVSALLQVLRSLARQCHLGHEIVIADDGSSISSTDELLKSLPIFSCPVRHIWHPDTGFTASKARNLGAIGSHGKYLVFLDGDCIPGPRFVEAHEALATKGYFVNGNRVLLGQELTNRVISNEIDILSAKIGDWIKWRLTGDANKLTQLLYWPEAPHRIDKKFHWNKIRSCNFAVWRDDFLRVNGFDESFEGWGHEDADLVLRLHNAGLQRKNGFWSTEVYHLWHPLHSRSGEAINRKRVFDRLQTSLYWATTGVLDRLNDDEVITTNLC